jgi:hypothetical protein
MPFPVNWRGAGLYATGSWRVRVVSRSRPPTLTGAERKQLVGVGFAAREAALRSNECQIGSANLTFQMEYL